MVNHPHAPRRRIRAGHCPTGSVTGPHAGCRASIPWHTPPPPMFRFLLLILLPMITDVFDAARAALPLPALMRAMGHEVPNERQLIYSPFRTTDKPHFTLLKGNDNRWRAMDQATGETWDEVDYIAEYRHLSKEDAAKMFLEMAGTRREEQRPKAPAVASVPLSPRLPSPEPLDAMAASRSSLDAALSKSKEVLPTFDWESCVKALGPEKQAELATWRGWPVEFAAWVVEQKLVGLHQGKWAIPVEAEGRMIGCHYRIENGDWLYTKGAKALPLSWGQGDELTVAFESQWDAYTLLLCCKAHELATMEKSLRVVFTRGASNTKTLAPFFVAEKCVGFQQNDPPSKDGKPNGNETWKAGLAKVWPGVEWASPPEELKDLNDWCRRDGAAMYQAAYNAVMVPKQERTSTMSVHSLWEVDQMQDDKPSAWLEDSIISEGEAVSVLGEGGLGKSRWVMQLVAHMILGRSFCGMQVHQEAQGKRWLFLQGENRKMRLKKEVKTLKESLGLSAWDYEYVATRIMVTTLLNADDFDLDTTDPARLAEITAVINDFRPDAVVADPLGDFTSEDMNDGKCMTAVAKNLLTAVRRGNPKRVMMFVHHALTGKDGAAKAVGWDAASFGRGSKTLHSKVRAQINLARTDPEDHTRIIVACGKNNNGLPFRPFGVALGEDGVYRPDEDFDLEVWKEEVNGTASKKDDKVKIPEKIIAGMVPRDGIAQAALQKKIQEDFNIGHSAAKTVVMEALKGRALRSKKEGHGWWIYHGFSV